MTTETALTLPERADASGLMHDAVHKECAGKRVPKFAVTGCAQCGQEFGPGDHGYSHCSTHAAERRAADERLLAAERAERDAAEAARRAAAEKTNGIRREIDAHIDKMADGELECVLGIVADMISSKRESA